MTKKQMSDHERFCKIFAEIGLTKNEFTRLYVLKNEPTVSDCSKIGDKLNGSRGVIKADIALIQYIKMLQLMGVDLKSIKFNEQGLIKN